MKENNIFELIWKAKQEVKNFGYSDSSIKEYDNCFDEILLYFRQQNINYFDYKMAFNYFKDKYNISDNVILICKSKYHLKHFRACQILNDINNGNDIKIQYNYKSKDDIKTDYYNDILNSFYKYINDIGLSDNVITSMYRVNKNFLIFLEKRKINDMKLVNYDILLSFISTMPTNRKSRNLYLFYLRTFLNYLYDEKIIMDNCRSAYN